LHLTWDSPDLTNVDNDACRSLASQLNRYLAVLNPDSFDGENMSLGLAQMVFTPGVKSDFSPDSTDRPFAGALLLSIGYNVRRGRELRASQIRIGVVGPSSLAGEVQELWHDWLGVNEYAGWSRQLGDELVVQLLHERLFRIARQPGARSRWDSTINWGMGVGNFATYAKAGAEWRIGVRLPDNFGSAPLRLAGENISAVGTPREGQWNAHFFAAIDGRAVLRDITLDGNTFKDSQRVEKRHFVADATYGVSVNAGGWRLAVSRYHRTREFRGQRKLPVYGALTISRRY
jgi:lipid A 3-O-deacylase